MPAIPPKFRCASSGQVVSHQDVGDGEFDCTRGADELPGRIQQYRCSNNLPGCTETPPIQELRGESETIPPLEILGYASILPLGTAALSVLVYCLKYEIIYLIFSHSYITTGRKSGSGEVSSSSLLGLKLDLRWDSSLLLFLLASSSRRVTGPSRGSPTSPMTPPWR